MHANFNLDLTFRVWIAIICLPLPMGLLFHSLCAKPRPSLLVNVLFWGFTVVAWYQMICLDLVPCGGFNLKIKLVHINLNYSVLGTSAAAIFLSNGHLYAPVTSDEGHTWFHLSGLGRPASSAWKAKKYKIKHSCTHWDLNIELWDS